MSGIAITTEDGKVAISMVKPDGKRITAKVTALDALDVSKRLAAAAFETDPDAISAMLRELSLKILELDDVLRAR